MPNGQFGENPFDEFLEEEPRALFFSFQDQFGPSPRSREFFRNQFSNIHDEFLGALGSQIRGGELPTLRFSDFLQNFDFGSRFASTPPSLRGFFPSQFAPPARFLF